MVNNSRQDSDQCVVVAVNEKAPQLNAEREAQLREQRRIERMMQREKANAKGKRA